MTVFKQISQIKILCDSLGTRDIDILHISPSFPLLIWFAQIRNSVDPNFTKDLTIYVSFASIRYVFMLTNSSIYKNIIWFIRLFICKVGAFASDQLYASDEVYVSR